MTSIGRAGSPPAQLRPVQGLSALILSDRARPLRFAFTGGAGALTQLALLAGLVRLGLHAVPANGLALLVSAQVNFALSYLFTWHDRRAIGPAWRTLPARWFAFHGCIATTAALNLGIFAAARVFLPNLIAAGAGIGVAAIVNFAVNDRLAFGRPAPRGGAVVTAPALAAAEQIIPLA